MLLIVTKFRINVNVKVYGMSRDDHRNYVLRSDSVKVPAEKLLVKSFF